MVCLILNNWANQILVAALVTVMIIVLILTFEGESMKRISKVPKIYTDVLLVTTIIVNLIDNFANGVVVGIMMITLFLLTFKK
jgi:sulfate permease, SulP family